MADQPTALRLAAQLEDTESARLHLLPYAAAELRRQHNLLDIANTVCRTSAKEIERLNAEKAELLEAAKLVIAWYEAEDDHSKADFYQRLEMCRDSETALRAAIAKAEGEQK
jgi:hypothetical protein